MVKEKALDVAKQVVERYKDDDADTKSKLHISVEQIQCKSGLV